MSLYWSARCSFDGLSERKSKRSILDRGLGVGLQKAVLLGWLIEAGKHVHASRINNEQENHLPSGSHIIAHIRGPHQHRMVGDEGRKEVDPLAHD